MSKTEAKNAEPKENEGRWRERGVKGEREEWAEGGTGVKGERRVGGRRERSEGREKSGQKEGQEGGGERRVGWREGQEWMERGGGRVN